MRRKEVIPLTADELTEQLIDLDAGLLRFTGRHFNGAMPDDTNAESIGRFVDNFYSRHSQAMSELANE